MTEEGMPRTRGPFLEIAIVCVAVSAGYILPMLAVTSGHFVPQVADLYLIAQYAVGFAEGHPFQYTPGDAPTTGATSLLHTGFLGLAHAIGFRGEGLIAFAILSGAVFMLLTALQAHRAALALGARAPVALLGAWLVVLNGPLAWSFHYGADIALVLFLSSWLFAAWVEADPAAGQPATGFVVPACLLALTRPEAAILVTLLGVSALWETRAQSRPLRQRIRFLLPALTAVLVLAGLRAFTGSAANTSFSQKLLSENGGIFAAAVISVDYWSDVLRGLLLGFYPATSRVGLGSGQAPFYAPPLLLVFVFFALLRKAPASGRALRFLQASLVTALAITPTIHVGFHFNRYLLFALPPLLVLMSLGLDEIATSDLAFRRLRIIALGFALLSVTRFALLYTDWASAVYQRDEALISFINQSLPKDARFLNNGTAIEYRTGRHSLNISGVVSPEFAAILPVETEASAFEILSRHAPARLPPYLIAEEHYVAESGLKILAGGPPIFVTSSLHRSELAIYPTRNDLLGRQKGLQRIEIPADLALTDSLNLTDPAEERAHGYRFRSSIGTRSLFGALKTDKYLGEGKGAGRELADGGRAIFGFEEFKVASPGQGELWLVIRTNPEPVARVGHPDGEQRITLRLPENRLRISTDRGDTGWLVSPLDPGWNEVAYRLPATMVGPKSTALRIDGRWSAFSYWVFRQP